MMLTKTCDVKVKAAGEPDGLEDGQFEALVSVFGNVDSYGDVVQKGAFKDTLAEWAASGDPIPVYYSHRMDDPDYNIGYVLEAKETDEGLWVKAQLDLDESAPKAKQVYRLLKGRRIKQFSFAYEVMEGGFVDEKSDGEDRSYYELRKLKLHEVGPTPIGANQETELLTVKRAGEQAARLVAELKAGRVLSGKNESALRDAHASLEAAAGQIKDVLAALSKDEGDGEEGKTDDAVEAKADAPANDEEPATVKSEEPTYSAPARARLLADLELIEIS